VATDAIAAAPASSLGFGQPGIFEQVYILGRRAFVRLVRQPGQLIFPFIFPIILFAVNASGLDAATKLPGFPVDDYKDFALAVPFLQGGLFVALNAGTDIASDIESGFLNRLSLTPMAGPALLAGQLGGVILVAFVQAIAYVLVGLAVGVGFQSGPAGVLVLLALSMVTSFAFAGVGAVLALRFGSGEAVQGAFPLLFVLMFLSSTSLPRNLIATDWFREVATYNPVSYSVEGIRSLIITGWDGEALALGFGVGFVTCVVALVVASRMLRSRLGRGK
jgi:ABC-2 type transport system permease protein